VSAGRLYLGAEAGRPATPAFPVDQNHVVNQMGQDSKNPGSREATGAGDGLGLRAETSFS
jgi:hypothetical protein